MKLQRYFSEISYDNEGRAEGTYAVADSNGIFVLADAHEARIAKLEKALTEIFKTCDIDVDACSSCGEAAFLATKALEGK